MAAKLGEAPNEPRMRATAGRAKRASAKASTCCQISICQIKTDKWRSATASSSSSCCLVWSNPQRLFGRSSLREGHWSFFFGISAQASASASARGLPSPRNELRSPPGVRSSSIIGPAFWYRCANTSLPSEDWIILSDVPSLAVTSFKILWIFRQGIRIRYIRSLALGPRNQGGSLPFSWLVPGDAAAAAVVGLVIVCQS